MASQAGLLSAGADDGEREDERESPGSSVFHEWIVLNATGVKAVNQ
jgi:hypothetical protein